MPLKRWTKISEETLFTNKWWKYKRDEFLLPDGKQGEYHYVHTNGASLIIPVLDDGKILMVQQYRYLNERESLEFPCGGVKDGNTYEETANFELREETGFGAKRMQLAGNFNPYNGVTNEICRIYIATSLEPVESQPDETEEFEKHAFFPHEIDDLIIKNIIWDGMTLAAWTLAKFRLQGKRCLRYS